MEKGNVLLLIWNMVLNWDVRDLVISCVRKTFVEMVCVGRLLLRVRHIRENVKDGRSVLILNAGVRVRALRLQNLILNQGACDFLRRVIAVVRGVVLLLRVPNGMLLWVLRERDFTVLLRRLLFPLVLVDLIAVGR